MIVFSRLFLIFYFYFFLQGYKHCPSSLVIKENISIKSLTPLWCKTINVPETWAIAFGYHGKIQSTQLCQVSVSNHRFSHLHGDFLHVHERLDVLLRDVFPGHGCKAGSGLLFQAQLPAEACCGHSETTSTHIDDQNCFEAAAAE